MIIEKTKQNYPNLPLQFSVVGYRDHPMRLSKMVMDLKKTALLKKQELLKIGPQSAFGSIKLSPEKYIKFLMSIES